MLIAYSGAVVSVFTGGAFFGAAIAGLTSDKLGRRWTIAMGSVIFCLGSGLQSGAQNLGYLYSGRVIAGLGVGILVMIVPLYQAEIAHPQIRGRLTGLQQFMIGIGAIVACKSMSRASGLRGSLIDIETLSILHIRHQQEPFRD